MNKNLKVAFVAAIAMVSGITVFNAQKPDALSDIALANVEALAENEVVNGCGGCATYYLGKLCCSLVIGTKSFDLYYEN